VLVVLFALFACERKQEVLPDENPETATTMQERTIKRQGSPLSIRNIRFAAGKLAGKSDADAEKHQIDIPLEKQLLYFRFELSEAHKVSESIDDDSTANFLDYPFAEVNTYRTAFEGAEVNIESLRDGKIYGTIARTSAANLGEANYQILDTLYQSDDDETDPLVLESLVQTGFVSANERIRICRNFLQGTIRHEDTIFGNTLQPVRGMQVYVLIFGVPRRTFTDENGFFQSRKRVITGGFVFTKAANPAMLVRPLNSSNGWLADIGNIASNLYIGALTAHGWRACRDMNNTHIEYRGHTQRNLWCHMMNAAFAHHAYMRADNLNAVTPRRLVAYAHWSETGGAASAPMLGKMITTEEALLAGFFALSFTDPLTVATLYILYKRLLPDLTINESADPNRRRSSAELMQTMFHELGHAAHFRNTGRANWQTYIWQIVNNGLNGQPCGSIYGCGNEPNAGIIQVGEAWAEFIGTEHARRYHPNGFKCSEFFRITTGNCAVRFDRALEEERWFEREFIPSGFFHDLRDGANPAEPWDNVQNVSIRQMYNALTPEATRMCRYIDELVNQNPFLNFADVDRILFVNTDETQNCNQ
jgi:hypothetical protein